MRIATEYLISHGWLLIPAALIGLLILGFGVFLLGGFEQNGCAGFTYFSFIDHKATEADYSMQLINGNQPVIVTQVVVGSTFDNKPGVSMENIQPHNTFVLVTEPLGMRAGLPFSSTMVRVRYDIINGPANLTDTAFCAGKVV
jgi:hypothetical protein